MACKRSGVRSPLAPFFYYMQNILLSLKTFSKTKIFFLVLLTVIIFCLYGKSINYDFINLDEDTLIEKNITSLSNIKNVPCFFLTSCYFSKTSFYYRPILTLSFSLETSLFGVNKRIYHCTNIILFILSLYLIYIFLLKVNINKSILTFVILLFAVHPIFITLPVWVPGRNDTLLIIFVLLSFIEFINYTQSKKTVNLILFLLFFILSIFTKESAIFLLLLYPLLLYCFKFNFPRKQTFYIISILLIIAFIYLCLRSYSVASVNITNYFDNISKYSYNIIFGFYNYILFLFFPKNIPTLLYNETINYKNILFISIPFIVLIIFYLKNKNCRRVLLFSIIWFLLFICPTFMQREYVFLTHRLFIASVGLIIILSLFIEKATIKFPFIKKPLICIFIILFCLFFYKSFSFQETYKNKETFWFMAYSNSPKYHLVSYNLANIYLQNGNYELYKKFMFQAYNLSTGDVHIFNIMPILLKEGQIDKVKEICFNILKDKDAKLFHKIGANTTLGNIYLEENNLPEAYKYLKNALQLDIMNINLKNKVKLLETKLNGN